MSRRAVVWLIPTFLTLHNAEEAIAFRWYLPKLPALLPLSLAPVAGRIPYQAMVQELAGLSLATFGLAFAVNARPDSRALLWLLVSIEMAIGLNGLAHVGSAVMVFRGYGPGLLTGITFNMPFAIYCFARVKREGWLAPGALRATLATALVLHGPVLFAGLWLAVALSRRS